MSKPEGFDEDGNNYPRAKYCGTSGQNEHTTGIFAGKIFNLEKRPPENHIFDVLKAERPREIW